MLAPLSNLLPRIERLLKDKNKCKMFSILYYLVFFQYNTKENVLGDDTYYSPALKRRGGGGGGVSAQYLENKLTDFTKFYICIHIDKI